MLLQIGALFRQASSISSMVTGASTAPDVYYRLTLLAVKVLQSGNGLSAI